MQLSIDLEDDLSFWMAFEQAAKLDAYCVVFHEIYLD